MSSELNRAAPERLDNGLICIEQGRSLPCDILYSAMCVKGNYMNFLVLNN